MTRHWLFITMVATLASLVGCSRSDDTAEVCARLEALELEQEHLATRLDSLASDLEPLGERVQKVDEDHRRVTRTLAQVEQDLLARLSEMIRQEGGHGRGRVMGRVEPQPQKPRPYLGFDAETVSAAIAKRLKLAIERGVLVTGVREGAPAEAGGLRKDDVVVQLDGAAVATKGEFARMVSARKPGDPITLGLLREGKTMELTITLGRR